MILQNIQFSVNILFSKKLIENMRIQPSVLTRFKHFFHEKPSIVVSIALAISGIPYINKVLYCYGEYIRGEEAMVTKNL
jgi:hypothetical protein